MQNIELDLLLSKHNFKHNGCECLQFLCSIATYPYRADYSTNNLVPQTDVMRHYATRQGMTLTLHGYKTNLSLLMMFCIIPFIQIYKLHENDDAFMECIHFSNNIRDDDRLTCVTALQSLAFVRG